MVWVFEWWLIHTDLLTNYGFGSDIFLLRSERTGLPARNSQERLWGKGSEFGSPSDVEKEIGWDVFNRQRFWVTKMKIKETKDSSDEFRIKFEKTESLSLWGKRPVRRRTERVYVRGMHNKNWLKGVDVSKRKLILWFWKEDYTILYMVVWKGLNKSLGKFPMSGLLKKETECIHGFKSRNYPNEYYEEV